MADGSLVLVIPAMPDDERDRVADAWSAARGEVLRLDRFWEPPPLDRAKVRLYGNDTFCLVLAQILELSLVTPPDDLLVHLAVQWVGRTVEAVALADAATIGFPKFVKPMVPKQFAASVYADPTSLLAATVGLGADTTVIVSGIVDFRAEVRTFVLDGQVRTAACYEGDADVRDATEFASVLATAVPLPRTTVLDVGLTDDGWQLIEANATWGSGLNGCDPDAVATCLRFATTST